MQGTVNAKVVRATLGVAVALGLDARALAEARGLVEATTDVDARFPHSAWLGLWQDIMRRTGSESLGIDAAERLPWGHWDVIDYLIGTSDNLGMALRRFERYFALVSTSVTHTLEAHDDTVQLVRRYAAECVTRLLAPAEFAFASLIVRMRMVLGFRWCPLSVRFACPAPTTDAAQRRFFGCPVHFEADTSAIIIESSALALPTKNPDPELGFILQRHAEMLVGQLGTEADLVGRARRVILNGLRDAEVSVAHTARRLGMSSRTLQRRLQEDGVTFDDLLDTTRNELARKYLGDPTLSIQEVAHLLAFGDLRGFYRAFRRWERCTPAEYRQRVRGAQPRAGAAPS
jgi:AraC-like DNA-binding protein